MCPAFSVPKHEVVATLAPGPANSNLGSLSAFLQDAASMQRPEANFKDGYWSQAVLDFGVSHGCTFPRAPKRTAGVLGFFASEFD